MCGASGKIVSHGAFICKTDVNHKSRRPRNPQPPAFRIRVDGLVRFDLRGRDGTAGVKIAQLAFDVGLQA